MGKHGKHRTLVKLGLLLACLPMQAKACGLALLLAIDVSLSVDDREFGLQTGGVAAALRDPSVISAIGSVEGGLAISVMQWSGRDHQSQSLGWTKVSSEGEILALADQTAQIPRAFASETAPGSALMASLQLHGTVNCARHVTDVSGDGIANTGSETRTARDAAIGLGHTINGLVILGDDARLEGFYRHNVIGGPGHFLEIAQGFDDYGRAMKEKLLKELPRRVASRTLP